MTDDDLERRLRDILRSRHLSIDPGPDALERVHVGAQRRHRRRMASSAAAAAVVVLAGAVAAGVTFRPSIGGPNHTIAATSNGSALASSITKSSPPPSPTLRSTPVPTLKPSSLISPPVAPDDRSGGRFNPVSVSAVSAATYWVLGYRTTATSDGKTITSELLRTTDGGASFTLTGRLPFLIGQAPVRYPEGTLTVADVRFGNATDGWAFSPTLFRTSDSGATWSRVTEIPGAVVDLVAANGVAWAVVDLSYNAATGLSPPESTPHFALYSTPYGNTAQHWSRVALPVDLGSVMPSIVDQDGTVTLLASGPLRDGYRVHALSAPPGKAFADHVGPCSQDLGGFLSNSKAAIWAVCPTGASAALFVSTDRGATWQPQSGPVNFPDPGAGIGAIDEKHAIVMDFATGTMLRLGRTGPGQPVDAPTKDVAGAEFIGFTNPNVGFAIVAHHDAGTSNELLRTTDGGLHWSVVSLAPSESARP